MIESLEHLPTIYLWLYVALAVAFLAQGIFTLKRGKEQSNPFAPVVMALFLICLGVHFLHFFRRWAINGHAPLQSKHEVFTATGLTTMVFGLILYLSEKVWKQRGAAGLLSGMVFVLLTGLGGILWTVIGMNEDYKVNNLMPALQSKWHAPHVSAYILGYGSLGLASILAFFYLIGALGKKATGGRWVVFNQMSSPLVDRWTYKIAGLGFPFMTAALCMGAVWADASWGKYWFWDAKETWALVSWAFYLIYFHLRFVQGWAGLKAQALVVGGGLMILVTYMAMHVLPASQASLHVYN